ncbi:hypothetical protein [Sphingomonas sp. LHG3406-1]|uniref:hypothetical protein n=1 Tax=Sphingomonas sp. LHG3406-1 TaxID=2804617 RepID=UPI00263309A8|nr:hypothetical protein [Sphingomonas sp. LHG3406-1]
MNLDKQLLPAAVLAPGELGAVLASLGPSGNARDRLAAVVALLTGSGTVRERTGGAFAGGPDLVTVPFTSGLHNCLRGQPVNAVQQSTTRPA